MATTAADPVFVDTNVLVYTSRVLSPEHRRAEGALRERQASGADLWISRQVIREYLAVTTRPQPGIPALDAGDAVRDALRYAAIFKMAEDGMAVTTQLLQLVTRFPTAGKQVHDANIVATMLVHGIRRILTCNLKDFERFQPLITVETP